MAIRVTSQIWVSALLRRAQAEGAFAAVLHKGNREAGAIYIVVRTLDGKASLYAPAPQFTYDGAANERLFELVLQDSPEVEIEDKLTREKSFDPEIWIVEIEDRKGRPFVDAVGV